MISGHVFIATSLDGFIARLDGRLDWLLSRDHGDEDHGYDAFIAGMDAILMGSGSYDTVAGFDPWPYDLPVVVLSSRLAGSTVPPHLAGRVRFSAETPTQAMQSLAAEGHARVYVDGGQVVQSCLRAGLIAELTLSTIPVLIGSGRPLFGPLPADLALQHIATRSFPSGLVQSQYRVSPG
jgi:dihydrofolate reductase